MDTRYRTHIFVCCTMDHLINRVNEFLAGIPTKNVFRVQYAFEHHAEMVDHKGHYICWVTTKENV